MKFILPRVMLVLSPVVRSAMSWFDNTNDTKLNLGTKATTAAQLL
jgi:hypothetical protein